MENYCKVIGKNQNELGDYWKFIALRSDPAAVLPPIQHLLDSLLLWRCNFTWDHLACFSSAGVDEREHRRRFNTVADAIVASKGNGVDLATRFNNIDGRFPGATLLVDGCPIPCRAQGGTYRTKGGKKSIKNYSVKYRLKCWKMEL